MMFIICLNINFQNEIIEKEQFKTFGNTKTADNSRNL